MQFGFSELNWLAVLLCVVVGQVFLTIWFTALFGDRWALAYGAPDRAQHAKEIPVYTYGIGLICMVLLTVGLALFQRASGIAGISAGISFGVTVALVFCVATSLPGYAFLRRWSAGVLAIGSQSILIVILSVILATWR